MDVKTVFLSEKKKKTGLCGCEDPALSAVRPPVNVTFLEMALVLKSLSTAGIHEAMKPHKNIHCLI